MPQKIRLRKQERKRQHWSEDDKRMEMQGKELGKGRKDLPLEETRAERMAAEEGRAMNKPTESKRVVAVMKGRVVAPKATKKVMESLAERAAIARAKKGISEERRK